MSEPPLLSNVPIPRGGTMPYYNRCKNCGKMKLIGYRCNSCFYTDPDEPLPTADHDSTCMCIDCIPTPKDRDDAPNTDQAESFETHHDLGGEAG